MKSVQRFSVEQCNSPSGSPMYITIKDNRCRTLTNACLAITFLALVPALRAQQVTGWTSLEWDPATQTVYGYAETDLDDYAAVYYAAALNTYLKDSNGNILASAATPRNTDESSVEAKISAHGLPGQTYTQNSEHFGIIQYESDCALPCRPSTLYCCD